VGPSSVNSTCAISETTSCAGTPARRPYDYAQTWIMTPADRLTGTEAVEYNRRRIAGKSSNP